MAENLGKYWSTAADLPGRYWDTFEEAEKRMQSDFLSAHQKNPRIIVKVVAVGFEEKLPMKVVTCDNP